MSKNKEKNVLSRNLEAKIKETFSFLEKQKFEEYKIGLINLLNEGYLEAYYYLGELMDKHYYQFGDAFYYFTKGAELEQPPSLHVLGLFYLQGKGVERDVNKAYYCINKAATYGYKYAQLDLGILYSDGVGCEKNLNHAKYWLEKAAREGLGNAQFELAKIMISEKNESGAIHWLKKGVEGIHVPSNFLYGLCLVNGVGVPKTKENKDIGIKFIKAAAKDNYSPAMSFLKENLDVWWNDGKNI